MKIVNHVNEQHYQKILVKIFIVVEIITEIQSIIFKEETDLQIVLQVVIM